MTIFEIIENNEDSELIISSENLLATRIIKSPMITKDPSKIEVTPLTYAVINKKPKMVASIINKIKEQSNPKEIVEKILNKEILKECQHLSMWQIIEGLSSYVNDYQNIQLRQSVMEPINRLNLRYQEGENKLNHYLPKLKKLNIEDLSELKQQMTVPYYFNGIVNLNFNEIFPLFKQRMKEHDLYHPYLNISNANDENKQTLHNLVQQIDSKFSTVETQEDMKNAFNELSPLLAPIAEYKSYMFNLFLSDEDTNLMYLKEDEDMTKLRIYVDLFNGMKLSEDYFVNIMLSATVDKKAPFIEDIESVQQLKLLLKNKNFKSFSIDKNANLKEVIKLIEEGSTLTENFYQLKEEELGGGKLSIHIDSGLNKDENLLAGYIFNHDLMVYPLKSVSHAKPSTFIHEYTHYLQDYQTVGNKKTNSSDDLESNKSWKKILKTLNSKVVSMDYVVSSSIAYFENYQMCQEDKNQLKELLTTIFMKEKSTKIEEINDIIKKSNFYNRVQTIDDLELRQLINEWVTKYITYVSCINQAYYSKSYFKTLWSEIDKYKKKKYWSSPVEIHARLVEKASNEEIKNDKTIYLETGFSEIKSLLMDLSQNIVASYKQNLTYKNENVIELFLNPAVKNDNFSSDNLVKKILNQVWSLREKFKDKESKNTLTQ